MLSLLLLVNVGVGMRLATYKCTEDGVWGQMDSISKEKKVFHVSSHGKVGYPFTFQPSRK